MPWRRSDHRQAVGQRRPRPAPGFADGLAEFDHAARGREVVAESGIDAMRRPQTLTLDEWGVLYRAYQEAR